MKAFSLLVCVVIASVSASTITDEQKQKARGHAANCVKEVGAPAETAMKLQTGDFSANDEKTQCFAKCFMEKAGFMDSHGNLNDDVIISKLSKANDENKVKALLAKCKQEKGNTACETAYKVYQCAYTNKAL